MGRASRALAVAVCIGALSSLPPSTFASYNARTTNPGSSISMTALYAPTSMSGSVSGSTVALSWPAGTNGSGYTLWRAANGSSSDCTAASFSIIATTAGQSWNDTPGSGGPYFCYRVATTYGPWTSVNANPTLAISVGPFRVTSVSASNGGTAGKLDLNDTIVFRFSEAVNTSTAPSGSNTLCATKVGEPNAQVLIGLTATAGACGTSQTLLLGKLTGAGSDKDGRFNATWVWSAGNTILTVTVGSTAAGGYPTIAGTLTFLPTTTTTYVRSQAGDVHVCDAGASCQPVMSGSF